MTRRLDTITVVADAEQNLQRLLERRERALDGAGPTPAPAVVEATEHELETTRAQLRKAMAATSPAASNISGP